MVPEVGGCIFYLSAKTLLLSLYKSGILDAHKASEIAGLSVGLGMLLSVVISYFVNNEWSIQAWRKKSKKPGV